MHGARRGQGKARDKRNDMQKSEAFVTWAIRLYAIGIAACAPIGYSCFLRSYGHSGGEQYRGNTHIGDEYFPPGVDYILFNFGEVTPISEGYYSRIITATTLGKWIFVAGAPFLLCGLVAYWKKTDRPRRGWRLSRWVWLALFFPRRDDPFWTVAAKLWFLFDFVALGLLLFVYSPRATEQAFIRFIWIIHAATAILALVTARVVTKMRRPGADGEDMLLRFRLRPRGATP